MPELPEVETVRRALARRLPGRTIVAVDVREPRLRTRLRRAELRRRLLERRCVGLGRRAKYLLVELSDAQVLVVHLGMSGRLALVPGTAVLEPHTHVRLRLDSGEELRFSDQRRFGMFFVLEAARWMRHPRFAHLGPEPLGPEFTAAYMHERARGLRRPMKNFLMDSSVVVGVGNIYASEALHEAGVHPAAVAGRLRLERWERVQRAVRRTLQRALRAGGTTLADFRSADGRAGEFQVQLRVYGRDGEPCARCGRTIRRLVQAGRSTFYCPGCQH
jgi:formamidopyrimidine-DNA glycosylase